MIKCIIAILINSQFDMYGVDISIHQATYDSVRDWHSLGTILNPQNTIFVNPAPSISMVDIADVKLLHDEKHNNELYLDIGLKNKSIDKFNSDNVGKWSVLMVDGKVYLIFKSILASNNDQITVFGESIQKIQTQLQSAIDLFNANLKFVK